MISRRVPLRQRAGRAHRNPSPEELFAGGPHLGAGTYEIGDPSLADEVGHGVDLFVRRGSERLSLELAAFANRIRDFVAFQPTGGADGASGLPIFIYEATHSRMRGGEATLSATNRLYRDHLSRVEERGFPMPARSLAVVLRTRF